MILQTETREMRSLRLIRCGVARWGRILAGLCRRVGRVSAPRRREVFPQCREILRDFLQFGPV